MNQKLVRQKSKSVIFSNSILSNRSQTKSESQLSDLEIVKNLAEATNTGKFVKASTFVSTKVIKPVSSTSLNNKITQKLSISINPDVKIMDPNRKVIEEIKSGLLPQRNSRLLGYFL